MIKAVNLRPGTIFTFKGALHEVVDYNHVKPGKGPAFVRVKIRNMNTGSLVSETMRPDDSFEDAFIEQKNMQYLYKDDMGYCFMDVETFEQVHIPETKIGDKKFYLKEEMTVVAKFHDGEVLAIEPPLHVILKITESEPGVRGDTVSGATKPATLETGLVVKVPLFVEPGQMIKVDTRTGEYIERA